MVFGETILEPSNVPRFLMFSFVLIFAFFQLLKRPVIVYPPATLFIFLLLFYFINLASAAWALNKADAFYESQKVLLGLCAIGLYINYISSEAEEHVLVKSIVRISIICAFVPLVQLFQLPGLTKDHLYNVRGLSEHRNLMASLLMLMLPFCIYGIVFLKSRWKAISWLGLLLSLLVIIATQVRSVYLGTLVGLLVFGLISIARFREQTKIFFQILVPAILFFGVVGSFSGTLKTEIIPHNYVASESGNERLKIWSKTLSLIRDQPILGVGAANWQYHFTRFGVGDIPNIATNNVTFQRPHNDVLWVLAETGMVGGLILILKMFSILRLSFYEIFRRNNLKVLLFFSFLCALITEAFFSFPKERITHIVLACLLLALLLRNADPALLIKGSSKLPVCIGILGLVLGLIVGVYRIRGEYFTRQLLSAKDQNDPREVIACGQKALSFFYATDPVSTPVYSYLGWAYHVMGKTDSVLYCSERAFQLSPYDFEVLSNYGQALDKSGRRDDAVKILEESYRINPYHEQTLLNLAVVEYNRRNYKESLRWLQSIDGYREKYAGYLARIEAKLKTSG